MSATLPPDASPLTPDAAAANDALARRWFATMNAGDLDATHALFAPDYRLHFPDVPADARGPEVIRAVVAGYREAFPDLTFAIEDTFAAGDRVLVRWSVTGTNAGPILGAPPTGRRASWTGMSLLRMRDGLIVEDWVETDRLTMLQQLGLAPR